MRQKQILNTESRGVQPLKQRKKETIALREDARMIDNRIRSRTTLLANLGELNIMLKSTSNAQRPAETAGETAKRKLKLQLTVCRLHHLEEGLAAKLVVEETTITKRRPLYINLQHPSMWSQSLRVRKRSMMRMRRL